MTTVSAPARRARPATDEALEIERNAYNAAFYALGLRWHWDGDTYAALNEDGDASQRVRRYIEAEHPHLLRAYDADFLVQAIERRKAEFVASCAAAGPVALSFDWAETRAAELGV